MIQILIADDHPVVRQGLKALIGVQSGMEVIGEAVDGQDAVAKARLLAPDVILLDLVMPLKDGVEAITEIKRENPQARILVLTSFGDDEKIFAAIEAGALGFLLKETPPDQLVAGIREVYEGRSSLDAKAVRAVVGKLQRPSEDPIGGLSKREKEVLALIGEGLSNQEIAGRLFVQEHTAAKHVSRILGKLNLANRTQAALLAVRRGLVAETTD